MVLDYDCVAVADLVATAYLDGKAVKHTYEWPMMVLSFSALVATMVFVPWQVLLPVVLVCAIMLFIEERRERRK